MLLRWGCLLVCSMLAVCWTESALGNQVGENLCKGVCIAASKATQLCDIVSTASRCQEDGQLCCFSFSVPDLTTEAGGAQSRDVEGIPEETGRQFRNIYLDILGVIAAEALRAAVKSEYEAFKQKAASFKSTKQPNPFSAPVTVSSQNTGPPSDDPSQNSPERLVSNNGTSEFLTPYDLDSESPTEPYVSYPSNSIKASAEGGLSSSSSGRLTAGSASETAQHSSSSPTAAEAVSTTEKPGIPCPGNCIPSFISWFCDNPKSDYECPQGSTCCVPATTTPEPEVPSCSGACLPAPLTGLCQRPARLLLKTTTCSRETICCTDTPRIW